MIAIKYQVFFFDPTQNRENRLCAIQPVFHSPSAVKVLLKTAKFEGKDAIVYSGLEDALQAFLKQVDRADVTDWLNLDFEKMVTKLDELAEEHKLLRFELNNQDDTQILGDPPPIEDLVYTVEAKRATRPKYPPDVSENNRWLWADIKTNYRTAIQKRCGKDPLKKDAALRILYYNAARRLGLVPYSATTTTQLTKSKSEICRDIEAGEAKASELIAVWERHLKSDGIVKKTKAIKYLGSNFEDISSRYYIAHVIEWTLATDWKSLSDYLTKGHGFHMLTKDHLSMTINRLTKLEVIQDGSDKASLYISHVLTPDQAKILTSKEDSDAIVKKLHKYSQTWYKKGKFPSLSEL